MVADLAVSAAAMAAFMVVLSVGTAVTYWHGGGYWHAPVYHGAWYGAGAGAAVGLAAGAAIGAAATAPYYYPPYYGRCGYYPYPPCY